MQAKSTLRLAIQAAAATTALGVATQASAVDLNISEDVDASLYGYAQMNMSYDFDGDNAASTRAGSFAGMNDDDDDGHFGADVQQSRLGVKVNHASGVSVTVEGDFRSGGVDGNGEFRMRHAFGEYKGFLAGRTWSNYNSFVGATPTLDFDSLAGLAGLQDRTEQVRYTTGPMSFSLEDPINHKVASAAFKDGSGNYVTNDDGTNQRRLDTRQSAPTLTARIEDSAGAISYSAAGMVNRVTADQGPSDDSTMGYGVFGATTIELTDMLSVHGAANFTDGASGYLYRSGNGGFAGASAYVDDGDLESIKGYGGSLGASLDLGNGNSINIGYGIAKLDLDDAVDDGGMSDGDIKSNQNAMLNYQMTPVENVMMGVEYGYFKRKSQGGESTDANRVIFATRYSF